MAQRKNQQYLTHTNWVENVERNSFERNVVFWIEFKTVWDTNFKTVHWKSTKKASSRTIFQRRKKWSIIIRHSQCKQWHITQKHVFIEVGIVRWEVDLKKVIDSLSKYMTEEIRFTSSSMRLEIRVITATSVKVLIIIMKETRIWFWLHWAAN